MEEGVFGYYLWCDSWRTDMDDGQEDAIMEDWYIGRHYMGRLTKLWSKQNGSWKTLYND